MGDSTDRLDGLLREAFGAMECSFDLQEDAKPEAISPALYASILDSATKRSSELLASTLVESALSHDWSLDDLAEEAGADRDIARSFLQRGGDPRGLRARIMARLLWRAGVSPQDFRELIVQAVVSHARYPKLESGMSWARTAGLAGEERAKALEAGSLVRDPAKASKDAELYLEDVFSAWQRFEAQSR